MEHLPLAPSNVLWMAPEPPVTRGLAHSSFSTDLTRRCEAPRSGHYWLYRRSQSHRSGEVAGRGLHWRSTLDHHLP